MSMKVKSIMKDCLDVWKTLMNDEFNIISTTILDIGTF